MLDWAMRRATRESRFDFQQGWRFVFVTTRHGFALGHCSFLSDGYCGMFQNIYRRPVLRVEEDEATVMLCDLCGIL